MPTSTLIHHSNFDTDNPDVVKEIILELTIQRYINVALTSAFVYNSLITLDQEVKYFWPKPLSSVSLIYFANRYVGLLGVISLIVADGLKESIMSCKSMFWMSNLCYFVTIVLIDYILIVRVLALYYHDRRLAIFLKSLIGLEVAIGIYLLVYGSLYEEIDAGEFAEGITFCRVLRTSPVLAIITLVLPMTFGFILSSMTIYKAVEYWRLSSGFKGFYLIKVLIIDQGLYYACIISCCVLMIVANYVLQLQFNHLVGSLLCAAGGPTLLCILGGHLLINLKEASELGANGGTKYRSKFVSDIEFAEGAPRGEGQPSENAEDIPSLVTHSST